MSSCEVLYFGFLSVQFGSGPTAISWRALDREQDTELLVIPITATPQLLTLWLPLNPKRHHQTLPFRRATTHNWKWCLWQINFLFAPRQSEMIMKRNYLVWSRCEIQWIISPRVTSISQLSVTSSAGEVIPHFTCTVNQFNLSYSANSLVWYVEHLHVLRCNVENQRCHVCTV